MPRIIFKCPYIKPATESATAHRGRYVRYIATREGAQIFSPDKADLPATEKQRDMVSRLLREFPLSRGMFEYEDYEASPTQGNASTFITRAIEDNYDQIAKKENYIQYIAQRPRAEFMGAHGLFNDSGESLTLSRIAEEVANHPGNVWLPIISLRREDAARLGYDNAKQWQSFLTSYAMEIAQAMNIPWDQFRWYASFHDEGHHPHVHMVCYSADGKSGFLNKEGIAKIKSGMAKEIFRQELTEIYRQQTQHRDTLVQEAAETMARLIHQMRSGALENERIEQLMTELGRRLNRATGKKQYGYLKAPLKSIVDEIVDELEKDSRVAAAYGLWYQLREEVLRTYKDDLPERLPLSRQKEFKRIKNIVIEEAMKLDEESAVLSPGDEADEPVSEDADPAEQKQPEAQDEVPPTVRWNKRYKEARRLLSGAGDTPPDFERARALLLEEAQAGNALAMYDLGRMYRDGGSVKPDAVQAVIWFSQAAEQGHEYAMYALGKMDLEVGNVSAALRWFHQAAEQGNQYAQYALGKLYLLGRDIPQDKDAAVHWFTLSAEQGNEYAQYFLDHINDTKLDSLLTSATRLLHHMGRIFRDETPPPSGGVSFVESKLRRKIREKKIAMGHRPDDHEDQPVMSY